MIKILIYDQIDKQQWQELIEASATATWFQTPEAYQFYASVPDEMEPFAVGVQCDNKLVGVCVGYITQTKSPLKQFLTRRAIIIGGPLLADDVSEEELTALLEAIRNPHYSEPSERSTATRSTASHASDLQAQPIYVEIRNFHDYSRWKSVFAHSGFAYQPHLNFHVDTSSLEVVDQNLGKSRKRDIRTTIRDGVTPVYQPTIEQVRTYYDILLDLYKTKVKTPLFRWEWFEQLYRCHDARFILTKLEGKIVGGTVCMELKGKALYEWFACGIDGVYPHIYPSTYATYLGIKYAAENGCKIFDMMGAGKPEEAYGVRDFKAKFGGELVEHGRFLCVRKPLLYKLGKLGVKLLKKR